MSFWLRVAHADAGHVVSLARTGVGSDFSGGQGAFIVGINGR